MRTLLSGSETRKTRFLSLNPSLVNIFNFLGKMAKTGLSLPEGFQEKLSTSSYRPQTRPCSGRGGVWGSRVLQACRWSGAYVARSSSHRQHSWRLQFLCWFWGRDLAADSQVQGVASGQCSDDHSVCEFSSGLVEDSVVLVASDLQQQVHTVQMVQKFVPNILPDPVFQSVAGELESNKRYLEDGILTVRASSATAGDGNRSRLLEVIESVVPCLVTRFTNSPNSSLRVSSHANARALCFAAASATLSDPHSALLALPALIDARAGDSPVHGALNSGVLCRKGPTGTRRVKGGVSGPAEDLRPVAEVDRGKFSAGRRCMGAGCRFTSQEATKAQVPGGTGEVWPHLPSTRRFLIPDSRHLDVDWASGNRWAG